MERRKSQMAYSTEFRVKALQDYVNGKTEQQISETHGVSTHTLNNWKKRLLDTGNLDKKKTERKSGIPYKYKPEMIKAMLEKSKIIEPAKDSKDDKVTSSKPAKTLKGTFKAGNAQPPKPLKAPKNGKAQDFLVTSKPQKSKKEKKKKKKS
jgi:transposase-like protein